MLFPGKTITQINEEDLRKLIGVESESQTLDYKTDAYQPRPDKNGKLDWNKAEFCADLSSFANAFGGWIICGMKEATGIATELSGLEPEFNADAEIRRLEQAAHSGIEPRIPGLRLHCFTLSDPPNRKALLIYVPRSFIGPHRVKETSKFHMRRSNGKGIEMNVDELRIAFNLNESLTERVRNFRKDRIDILSSSNVHEDIPVVLQQGALLALHSVPLTTMMLGSSVALNSLEFAQTAFSNPDHFNSFARGARFNFHGVVLSRASKSPQLDEYFQIFRNGVVEYVKVLDSVQTKEEKLIRPHVIENSTLFNLPIVLAMQANLGIELPLAIMLSLVHLKGYKFDLKEFQGYYGTASPLDRDQILVPDVVIDDFSIDYKVVMKPVFDIVGNAGGLYGSVSYNENGSWDRPI